MFVAAIEEDKVYAVGSGSRDELPAPGVGLKLDDSFIFNGALRENDRSAVRLRQPEDRDLVSAFVGIGEEIATPSVVRARRTTPRLERRLFRFRRYVHSRADSPDYAAGTPRQSRRV